MSRRFVVMGPSGSGKTTVGLALAKALQAAFVEGDDLHPPANVEKMHRGEALTDKDRWPWLARVAQAIADFKAADRSAVIACSALKRIYRDRLREADPDLRLVVLTAPLAILETRLKGRQGHFMPATLAASQVATLEPPDPDENALMLDAAQTVDSLVAEVLSRLP